MEELLCTPACVYQQLAGAVWVQWKTNGRFVETLCGMKNLELRRRLADTRLCDDLCTHVQVVFGHLYGIFLLHDPESFYGILGSLVICVGVIAVSWPSRAADAPALDSKADAIAERADDSFEMARLVDGELEEERRS